MKKSRCRAIAKASWRLDVYENKKYWTAIFKSIEHFDDEGNEEVGREIK